MLTSRDRWLLLAIWTPLKTKLSTGGCLRTSEFVCTTEQRDRSREKAREGHRSASLHYTHARAIVQSRPSDYVVSTFCKQQLISCRLQLAYMYSVAVLIKNMQLARSYSCMTSPRHQHLWCYFSVRCRHSVSLAQN